VTSRFYHDASFAMASMHSASFSQTKMMTMTLNERNKPLSPRKTAIVKGHGDAVAEGDKHLAGMVMKACMALALLQMLTACTARPPVASEKAQHAEALFKLHCATAGEKIKRTVKDVEGIFLLKGRPKNTNFSDQFVMDDPYGSDFGGDGYIKGFLKAEHELPKRYAAQRKDAPAIDPNDPIGFDYVEMADPHGSGRFRYTAHVYQPGKTDPTYLLSAFRVALQKSPSTGAAPRYGVTYDDISTQEDRKVWIAGSSLKVIDLQTNEVIAERVGYMIDRGQGVTAGGRSPWFFAARAACPSFPEPHAHQAGQTARFVEKVLAPVRYAEQQD